MQAPPLLLQSKSVYQTKSIWRGKKQKRGSAEELINVVAVSIPWVLIMGKQKLTNRVNGPPKDWLDYVSGQQRDSLVELQSAHWNSKHFTGHTLTEQGRFIQYNVDPLNAHNNTDAVLNDDEVKLGKSHYPKLISCFVSALITEEKQRETDGCPHTLYGTNWYSLNH